MTQNKKKGFLRGTKNKVIIGFVIALLALGSAWVISKFAFKTMLTTVEQISAPNDRLRSVTQLSHYVSRLDQLQRDQAVNHSKSGDFIKVSKALKQNLDTLTTLYANDKRQLSRIKSIKRLLADRDKQFLMYLKVRETLVNTKSFSEEVKKLNDLIGQKNTQADSAVFTETSTSTTMLEPQDGEPNRGFLAKLFGKKRSEVYKIISEEYKIKRDTVNQATQDSIINNIETSLKSIEDEQKAKSSRFIKRELDLATASTQITNQMLNILREVEAEAVSQVDKNSEQAKAVVNQGIDQISLLLIGFFLLTVILLYLILADISKVNRYRKELEVTKDVAEYHSKAKQRFLSNMSHEIRTPLQSILGYAEQISKQDKPNKKDVDAIYQSSVHLLQIVNEVLDYNRIISGEFTFNNQPFAVEQVLDEVVAVMRPLAEKKQLQLVTDYDLDEVDYVNGDAFRLKQVLFNLIGNAIKFTIKGKITLALSIKRQEDIAHLHFTIKDTGIGFDESYIDNIFNEFEQIESKEKYLYNQTGTGLGLAIVKSLIESQEGRINVRSTKNKGTTFTIHLSCGIADKPAIEATKQRYQLVDNGHVWVIDDDNLILELCGLIFTQNQVSYSSFNNANDVLDAIPHPDLKYVLVDMRLPEMSGLELHRILKRKLPKEVKFYAMTAQVLPDERQSVLDEGFAGIIMKPFRANDILSIFDKVMMPKQSQEFDLSLLEKMTMGDEALMEKILSQFMVDCQEDASLLAEHIENENQDEARLITHRLAGRLAQFGAKDLAHQFREAELVVVEDFSAETTHQLKNLIIQLQDLLIEVEQKHYSMP